MGLFIDIFHLSRIAFLGSISKHLLARMVQHVTDMKKATLFDALKKMVRHYASRGFVVKYMWADNQFEPLREDLLSIGVKLNVCCANEHVPLIERDIRTIKQRYRGIRHSLPYITMPSLMVVHLVMLYTSG